MVIPLGAALNAVDVFLLVFVRMTGLFVVAPIFSRRNIPTTFKVGFSFLLALILMNTLTVPNLENYTNLLQYVLLIAREFLVGITIGYVAYLVFISIYIAGQIIDMQIGFGMVNVIDPMSNIQVPVTSNFYFILSMLLFLMANGHHLLIRALFESFKLIPLGGAVFSQDLMNDILRAFGNIFVVGFKISAPIVAAILITDVALGVISRTVPQLNVFVVGMPLKILLGVAVMVLTIPLFISITDMLINGMGAEMLNFIKDMGLKR